MSEPLPPPESFTDRSYLAVPAERLVIGQTPDEFGGFQVVAVAQSLDPDQPSLATMMTPAVARQVAASLLNHADGADERNREAS